MRFRDYFKDPLYRAILYYISENECVTPDEIASLCGFTRQAADYRLKKLVNLGLIEKKYVEGRICYSITDKGIEILGEKEKPVKKTVSIVDIISKIGYLFIAIGLIGLAQYVASGEFSRGILCFIFWMIIALIFEGIIKYFKKKL